MTDGPIGRGGRTRKTLVLGEQVAFEVRATLPNGYRNVDSWRLVTGPSRPAFEQSVTTVQRQNGPADLTNTVPTAVHNGPENEGSRERAVLCDGTEGV